MAFHDIYTKSAATLTMLRSNMDVACKTDMEALVQALFAECPTVNAILWQQSITPTAGFSLGTIYYSTSDIPGIIPAKIAAPSLAALPRAANGPTQVKQFAAFLNSILYHLYCVYGRNLVVVSRTGTAVLPV